MSENHVNRESTTITPQDFANALAEAWPIIIGGDAPLPAVLVLLAQSAFETDHWKACGNWNFGNVKHFPGDGYDYYTVTCKEGYGANEVTVPNCAFRSYGSLEEGVEGYLKLMHGFGGGRAWPYALDGDPEGFVQALWEAHYFTGNLTDYINGVLRYFKQFGGIVPMAQMAGAALLGLGGVGALVGAAIFYAWNVWKVDYGRRY